MIAKEYSIAVTTVDSAMNTLTALGLVHKINRKRKDGSKSSNQYQVSNLIEFDSS
jgi:DNA-binding GntR family transcriptional regulator